MNVPYFEIKERVIRLQAMLLREGFDGAFLFQNVDLFYCTGTMQPAVLYLPSQGEPLLLVRKNIDRAREESSISQIVPFDSLRRIPGLLSDVGHSPPQTIGLELDVLPAQFYLQIKKLFPSSRILDVSPAVRRCRMIKSSWEIDNLAKAGEMCARMIKEVPEILKPGMSELAAAGRLEISMRRQGHQGFIRRRGFNQEVFYGHILSGPSGAVSSYVGGPSGGTGIGPAFGQGAGTRPLQTGEPISIDYVGCYNGYIADQTRMFSIGRPDDEVLRAYDAACRVHDLILQRTCVGVSASMVYRWALEEIERLGLGAHFMGVEDSRVPFVGHGVGLELDEFPLIGAGFDLPLEENMVIAFEPKLVLPKHGLVGIENTFLLTRQGLTRLTLAPENFGIL